MVEDYFAGGPVVPSATGTKAVIRPAKITDLRAKRGRWVIDLISISVVLLLATGVIYIIHACRNASGSWNFRG